MRFISRIGTVLKTRTKTMTNPAAVFQCVKEQFEQYAPPDAPPVLIEGERIHQKEDISTLLRQMKEMSLGFE
jgi:hypothetical protein